MRIVVTVSRELLEKNEDIEIVLEASPAVMQRMTMPEMVMKTDVVDLELVDAPVTERKGNGIPAWSREQDEYLAENWGTLSMQEIIDGMPGYKRSKQAIYVRAAVLKITKRRKPRPIKPTAQSMGVSRIMHRGRPPADCDCGRCNEKRDAQQSLFKERNHIEKVKVERGELNPVELDKKSASLIGERRRR